MPTGLVAIMLVVKRDGKSEPVAFDKITARIKKLCYGFDPKHVDATLVAQKVVAGVYDGVTTVALDDLASETAAFLTTQHPDYGRLAARIAVSNLHKQTEKSFTKTMLSMHGYLDPHTKEAAPLISEKLVRVTRRSCDGAQHRVSFGPSAFAPRTLPGYFSPVTPPRVGPLDLSGQSLGRSVLQPFSRPEFLGPARPLVSTLH